MIDVLTLKRGQYHRVGNKVELYGGAHDGEVITDPHIPTLWYRLDRYFRAVHPNGHTVYKWEGLA